LGRGLIRKPDRASSTALTSMSCARAAGSLTGAGLRRDRAHPMPIASAITPTRMRTSDVCAAAPIGPARAARTTTPRPIVRIPLGAPNRMKLGTHMSLFLRYNSTKTPPSGQDRKCSTRHVSTVFPRAQRPLCAKSGHSRQRGGYAKSTLKLTESWLSATGFGVPTLTNGAGRARPSLCYSACA
jgi:hypothetical protein